MTSYKEGETYLYDVIAPDFYNVKDTGMIKILDETDFKSFSFAEIRAKLKEVDGEMFEKTGYGLDAVIWDHANLFKYNGSGAKFQSEGAEINAYVSYIRKLSIKFRKDKDGNWRKLAMLVLAQSNRDGFKRAQKLNGAYDLRAISEANELERSAMKVYSIYTSEEDRKSTRLNSSH